MKSLTTKSLFLFLLILFFSRWTSVYAATIEADGATCSLRNAILSANQDSSVGGCTAGSGDDTINLSHQVSINDALPELSSDMTINGRGNRITADVSRHFTMSDGEVFINNVQLRGGVNTSNGGGSIRIWGGELQLRQAYFSGNTGGGGGALHVRSTAEVTILQSSFQNNTAGSSGSSSHGGAIEIVGDSVVTIRNTTFFNNSAYGKGGAIYVDGSGDLNMYHVTIWKNRTNVSSDSAGGLHRQSGRLRFRNTLIGLNTNIGGNSLRADCFAESIGFQRGNWIRDDSCDPAHSGEPAMGSETASSNPVGIYVPFASASSGPVDAADDTYCESIDQLGTTRPQPAGGDCDIGAYELRQSLATDTPVPTNTSPPPTDTALPPTATNVPVVAAWSWDFEGLQVNFFNDSTGDFDRSIWQFGDGDQVSGVEDPTHTYDSAGTYSVLLLLSKDGVGVGSHRADVTVYEADFSYTVDDLEVTFSNDTAADNLTYLWRFGDGSESRVENPTHEYSSGGTYTVALETYSSVHDGGHTVEKDVTVVGPTAAPTDTPAPTNTSVPGDPPEPELEADFSYSANGLTVNFTSTSTGTIQSYLWQFGDGTQSTEANPTHTYAEANTYRVILLVRDSDGSNATLQDVTVASGVVQTPVPQATPLPGDMPEPRPTADFTYNANGLRVSFRSTSTGANLSYSWSFGDGRSSTQANPTHTYASADRYNVTLRVSNSGGSDSRSRSITVEVAPTRIPGTAETSRKTSRSATATPIPTRGPSTGERLAAQGYRLWARYGLGSGVEFQRVTWVGIANSAVVNLGLIDALDVWAYVEQGVEVCLPGTGHVVFLDAATSPRTVYILNATVADGYTCATLNRPGTVVLVEMDPSVLGAPTLAMPIEATPGPTARPRATAALPAAMATPLANCMVFTQNILNFRAWPDGEIFGLVPAFVTLTALERTANWFKVDNHGTRGWISARYVTPVGSCWG